MVGPAPDGPDARAPRRARRGGGRRPARQAAHVGPRRALVPRDRDASAAEGPATLRGEALPHARRAAAAWAARRPPRRRGRPDSRARHVPLSLRPTRPRPRSHPGALELLLPARDVPAPGAVRGRLLSPSPAPTRAPRWSPR